MADHWKAPTEVHDIMLELVGKYHPDLAQVSEEGIAIVFYEKAAKSAPFGAVSKVSPMYGALIEDEVVFILRVPMDVWTDSDPRVRKAILDYHLCACRADLNEDTGDDQESVYKYYTAKPDIMAYHENLERYGNWFKYLPNAEKKADDAGPPQSGGIFDLFDGEDATVTVTVEGDE